MTAERRKDSAKLVLADSIARALLHSRLLCVPPLISGALNQFTYSIFIVYFGRENIFVNQSDINEVLLIRRCLYPNLSMI